MWAEGTGQRQSWREDAGGNGGEGGNMHPGFSEMEMQPQTVRQCRVLIYYTHSLFVN